MAIQLDRQASLLLARVQHQSAPVTQAVEQAIAKACEKEGKALNAKQLEQVLVEALPTQQKLIKDTAGQVGHQCDGASACFLTNILSLRIEKEDAHVYNPPAYTAPPPRRLYDPLMASFQMDPKADILFLYNARDVDETGRPLLMKIVARERAKAQIEKLDLSQYRTQTKAPDVEYVPNAADVVDVKDVHESEFAFGDPLLVSSHDKNGKEISRALAVDPANQLTNKYFYGKYEGSTLVPNVEGGVVTQNVQTGPNLDRQAVVANERRIQLRMEAKDTFPKGGWLDTPLHHVTTTLIADRGLIFEPGASATVSMLGGSASTSVPKDDAYLLGSPTVSADVNAGGAYNGWSLRQVLQQNVNLQTSTTGANASKADQATKSTPAYQMIFSTADKISVGGGKLAPLEDRELKLADFEGAKIAIDKRPLAGDADCNGQKVTLTLSKGFLGGEENASVKGWKIVVGYTDPSGAWQESDARVVKGSSSSGEERFTMDLSDAPAVHKQNRNIEVRVFNELGVPAQRVLIPFRQVQWAEDAFAT